MQGYVQRLPDYKAYRLEELNENCCGGGLFILESLYQTIDELDTINWCYRAKRSYS